MSHAVAAPPGSPPRLRARTLKLGVIGFGGRAAHMLRLFCNLDPDLRIAAIADPMLERARAVAAAREFPDLDDIDYVDDFEALLARAGDLDGFVVGTPCHLHTPLAVRLAAVGRPLFLEKPVAITWDQYHALEQAWRGREDQVVVSFPLRLTNHVRQACELIRSGRLGTINQIQAINNVPYGGVYFGQWFRDYERTGGLWLQKATHDFDYINQLMMADPLQITAMHSRTIYGGIMPPEMRCSRCDQTDTCKESPVSLTRRQDDGGVLNWAKPSPECDHDCCFSSSIKNQDAGSAIVMYASGAHAAYSQNFIPRRSAGRRGATIIGYEATLSFDWYTNQIIVIDHHRDRVDRLDVDTGGFHGGGDNVLARSFVDVLRGRAPSQCPLDSGLLSAAMCLAARDSAANQAWQAIPRPAALGRVDMPQFPDVEPPQ